MTPGDRFPWPIRMLMRALLAAVGLYVVVASAVGRRRREIGIRMALGAGTPRVVGAVLRQGGAIVGVGLVLGGLGALLSARLVAGVLHGVGPLDPVSYAVATALLLLVAAVATLLPARRAAAIDPAQALREE